MDPLDLVKLTAIMERSRGRPEIKIGVIDGPVAMGHPGLATEMIWEIPGGPSGRCTEADSAACMHGTFVAGILSGKRDSAAPAICPGCTLLVRPIFPDTTSQYGPIPSATQRKLTAAIVNCVDAGAGLINLSLALVQSSSRSERDLDEVLDHVMRRGVIVVAAAGNQGTIGSTAITCHPWVIPVVACERHGRPLGGSLPRKEIGYGLAILRENGPQDDDAGIHC